MLDILTSRLKQGHQTIRFPDPTIKMGELYRGSPVFNHEKCNKECSSCKESCPADAISFNTEKKPEVDIGKCIFCPDCSLNCPEKAVKYSSEYRMSAFNREDLLIKDNNVAKLNEQKTKLPGFLKESLKLRQVSAGGCNACEADLNVLGTIGFDLGRFGIQFVASPRHADGIVVTGPVTNNMLLALKKTYEAIPTPKVVIAVGSCAISGGLFRNKSEVNNGITDLFKVDLFIPGCPPHPLTILDGLLRLTGKT